MKELKFPPAELNELLSEFILSVRTKEGQDYEPSSLRGMVASFERHLKRKSYPASINYLQVCPLIFMKVAGLFLTRGDSHMKQTGMPVVSLRV